MSTQEEKQTNRRRSHDFCKAGPPLLAGPAKHQETVAEAPARVNRLQTAAPFWSFPVSQAQNVGVSVHFYQQLHFLTLTVKRTVSARTINYYSEARH